MKGMLHHFIHSVLGSSVEYTKASFDVSIKSADSDDDGDKARVQIKDKNSDSFNLLWGDGFIGRNGGSNHVYGSTGDYKITIVSPQNLDDVYGFTLNANNTHDAYVLQATFTPNDWLQFSNFEVLDINTARLDISLTGDIMRYPEMRVLNMTGCGDFDKNEITTGGPVGPKTEELQWNYGNSCWLNFDSLGADSVGGGKLGSLKVWAPPGNQQDQDFRFERFFKSARNLEVLKGRFLLFNGADLRGAGIMPPSIVNLDLEQITRIGDAQSVNPGFVFDDWSNVDNLSNLKYDGAGYKSGTRHMVSEDSSGAWVYNLQTTLDGLFTYRDKLNGNNTSLSFTLGRTSGYVCHSVGMDNISIIQSVFGLKDYHPNHSNSGTYPTNLWDAVNVIGGSLALNKNVDTDASDSDTIAVKYPGIDESGSNDSTLPDYDTDGSKGGFKIRYDSSQSNNEIQAAFNDQPDLTSSPKDSTIVWKSLFKKITADQNGKTLDNDYIRLIGTDSTAIKVDKQYKIASHSYDPSTGIITINIDTNVSEDGVSTSVPLLLDGEVVYPKYYETVG